AVMAVAAGKWGAGESYFLGTLAAACILAAGPIGRLLEGEDPSWRRELERRWQQRRAALGALALRTPGFIRSSRARGLGRGSSTTRYALATVLLLQAVVLAHGPLSDVVGWLPDRGFQAALLGSSPSERDQLAGEEIASVLRASALPVLAENPSVAMVAGKPIVGNATHLRNLQAAGLWRG